MKIGMVIGGLLLVAMSFFMLFSYQPEILCFLVLGAGVWMLMHSKKERDMTPLLKKQGTQTILASLLCIVLGLLVGYIVLLIINPLSALWFGVFIIILQQLDGNVIGPFILGDYVGVSAFWIMIAIVVGGGLFGFWGMLLGVPVFALGYAIVRSVSEVRLRNKNLPTKTDDYKDAPENLHREGDEEAHDQVSDI